MKAEPSDQAVSFPRVALGQGTRPGIEALHEPRPSEGYILSETVGRKPVLWAKGDSFSLVGSITFFKACYMLGLYSRHLGPSEKANRDLRPRGTDILAGERQKVINKHNVSV